MKELEPGEQEMGGNLNPSEQTEQSEPAEKSPESIDAQVFLHEDTGLVVLCPREEILVEVVETDNRGRALRDKVVSEKSGVLLFSRGAPV